MVSNALGLQEEEERESSFVSEEVLGRSSERMALDWVSAVGSTGSLISSWTSAGVRGVSMVDTDEEEGEKELIDGGSNVKIMRVGRRLRAIEYTSYIENCDEVEARKEK